MTAIIENKHTIPKHPAHVLAAEKILKEEVPVLYAKIAHFRDCKNEAAYIRAKAQLEISRYSFEEYHKTLADFCNV